MNTNAKQSDMDQLRKIEEVLQEKDSAWLEALVRLIEASRSCTPDQIDRAVKALKEKG